jgi:uncharacterized protein
VLLADRAGGNGQLLSLAEALGWPCERKTMAYNAANRLPNLLLGTSLASVREGASSALEPPWPDLVLGASRRSVPVARWIRARSGGRTKLVHLLHAMAPLDLFDLVITTPQYRLPARPNVLQLAAPLNRIAAATLHDAAARWSPRLAHLPRPFVALLVGGDSATYRFDATVARRLVQAANAAVAQGGTLLVSTSPRTAATAADALAGALIPASFVYRWRPGDVDNPYHAFLALADRFIVTADSASQLVEAVMTGKPVEVFSWPARRQSLLQAWLWRENAHGAAGLVERLVDWGLLKPPRDFAALQRALQARGLIGSAPGAAQRRPLDDMEQAVAAIRRLFAAAGAGARVDAPPR